VVRNLPRLTNIRPCQAFFREEAVTGVRLPATAHFLLFLKIIFLGTDNNLNKRLILFLQPDAKEEVELVKSSWLIER